MTPGRSFTISVLSTAILFSACSPETEAQTPVPDRIPEDRIVFDGFNFSSHEQVQATHEELLNQAIHIAFEEGICTEERLNNFPLIIVTTRASMVMDEVRRLSGKYTEVDIQILAQAPGQYFSEGELNEAQRAYVSAKYNLPTESIRDLIVVETPIDATDLEMHPTNGTFGPNILNRKIHETVHHCKMDTAIIPQTYYGSFDIDGKTIQWGDTNVVKITGLDNNGNIVERYSNYYVEIRARLLERFIVVHLHNGRDILIEKYLER